MTKKRPVNYVEELQELKDAFELDFIALSLIESAAVMFKWKYVVGNQSERYRRIRLKPGRGVVGNVFKTGKAMLVSNIDESIPASELFTYPVIVAESLKSFCAIPLYQKGRVKGVLLGAYRENNQMTSQKYLEFQQAAYATFSVYFNKEMVND